MAVGEDTLEFIAGTGIQLTTNSSSNPKSITVSATSSGSSGSGSVTVESNSGLGFNNSNLTTLYNTTVGNSVMSVSVGGAPAAAASTWKTKTLVQVLDTILFPTVQATYSPKSASLSFTGSTGNLEIGTQHSRTLTATLSRGTITNGDGSSNSNPLVGAATSYTFTGTGISSTSGSSDTLSVNHTVVAGTNQWSVSIAHGAGTGDYYDNKGIIGTNLSSYRVSGTSSANSSIITGVYPYFYLKSSSPITLSSFIAAIGDGTASKVVNSSSGTLSIPYNVTAKYIAVAYPSDSTTKTNYYVTVSDNGPISAVFSAATNQTVTTTLWSKEYTFHLGLAALTNSNATIELRN